MTRKTFLRVSGAAASSLLIPPFSRAAADSSKFYFALIADSHIIDPFYKGPEGNQEDTESIFKTAERLEAARAVINALQPRMEKVFLIGDYFHNYPSRDVDFYFKNQTRIDHAKAITDKFTMPVHVGFGNHDYDVNVPREMSHELFRRKLGVKPYYSVELHGWKFIHLNNFLGDTWTKGHAKFKPAEGSLGEEQLNWFEAELREHKPSFVFIHYPLSIVSADEVKDYGVHRLIKQHRDTIQRVVSGHWHRWYEFGRSYGPQHLVMAATRYDPNAYLIVEADMKAVTHQLLNIDLVDWNTHYSQPFRGPIA
ncbi:MAG TPA: metallophosphoesterase [Bryobacteraceae bacterium]|nr:metallophosphoesterase [Bryobacteraceae bacterium]